MSDIYNLVWFFSIALIVFSLMFFSLQRLDFSKLFKANSSLQINIFIVFISLATSFGVSIGILKIVELIANIIART